MFDLHAGDYHSLGDVDPGTVPVASCSALGNGIIGTYDIASDNVYRDALTVAFNGSPLATMLHPYTFGAKDDVAVCLPPQDYPPEALLFMQAALNAERWRFSYYRKCFMGKLKRIAVELPVKNDGSLDVDFMVAAVRAQTHWWFLAPRLSGWHPALSPKSAAAAK